MRKMKLKQKKEIRDEVNRHKNTKRKLDIAMRENKTLKEVLHNYHTTPRRGQPRKKTLNDQFVRQLNDTKEINANASRIVCSNNNEIKCPREKFSWLIRKN